MGMSIDIGILNRFTNHLNTNRHLIACLLHQSHQFKAFNLSVNHLKYHTKLLVYWHKKSVGFHFGCHWPRLKQLKCSTISTENRVIDWIDMHGLYSDKIQFHYKKCTMFGLPFSVLNCCSSVICVNELLVFLKIKAQIQIIHIWHLVMWWEWT